MNLEELKQHTHLKIDQLSHLLGIPQNRLNVLLKDYTPTKYELIKINRLGKLIDSVQKPMTLKKDLEQQHLNVSSGKLKIRHKLETLVCMNTTEQVEKWLEETIENAMILGIMYANNNLDQPLLDSIREKNERKLKV